VLGIVVLVKKSWVLGFMKRKTWSFDGEGRGIRI
jgi:hypothetical protein